ncbi:heptosyltransferase III [Oryzomicrobium terrae]|uniref:Heptosyltransferase III n=1 Tax=Oryzomicrobium terrae TaxID=1735038 RepID=A0A5C1ECL5_9RHOO|nr:putative lipopolysaccharide heptosyltransferase III [Oryzomicrobium terrae]QEL66359.1 heptosyltransferase III [Oryzomicrobium terrae]
MTAPLTFLPAAAPVVPDPVPLADLKRVLVIKLRHHGDVLLSAPVFSVLKAAAPHAEIDALVYADTREMLTGHPAISAVHCIDRNWKKRGPLGQLQAEWGLLRTLRGRRYDLVLHLTEHRRGAWITRLSGARYGVAPRVKGRDGSWAKAFTHFVAKPGNALRHTVERNLDFLRRIGIYPAPEARGVALVPGAVAEAKVEALLAGHGLAPGAFIHLHPASRWMFKGWTTQAWIALATQLVNRGQHLVFSGAPGAAEEGLVAAIIAALPAAPGKAVSLAGQLSLKELAALTARARAFVGVDSAPMHIAAAMGTPAVALFGPSGDKEWGPWPISGAGQTVSHRVVASTRHPCRPCGIDGCGGGKVSDCLVALTPEAVFAALDGVLAEAEGRWA